MHPNRFFRFLVGQVRERSHGAWPIAAVMAMAAVFTAGAQEQGHADAIAGGDPCLDWTTDCNDNQIDDGCDIDDGTSSDCNDNGVPDECEDGDVENVIVHSIPVASEPGVLLQDGGTLWRTQRNIVRLTFACDITAPDAGEIQIRRMLPGGAYGDDLSNSFTFIVENNEDGNPRILRIHESRRPDNVLEHRTWYAISHENSWEGVQAFEPQFLVMMGDANGDGMVANRDVSLVHTQIPCFFNCPERLDIDGNGFVNGLDRTVTNPHIPSFPVAKPFGHDCAMENQVGRDCNGNDVDDGCDVATGAASDCNDNGVLDECEGGAVENVIVDSFPVASQPGLPLQDGGTLWRTKHNIVRFTFACDITSPDAGDILVRAMLPGGAHGPDLSNSFTFAVENDKPGNPRILRIQQPRDPENALEHRVWYAISHENSWEGVQAFETQYLVMMGDTNGDGFVSNLDVSLIETMIPCFVQCPERLDILGNGFINGLDIGHANLHIPSFPIAKPSGH